MGIRGRVITRRKASAYTGQHKTDEDKYPCDRILTRDPRDRADRTQSLDRATTGFGTISFRRMKFDL
jgi:hypothetical protein